MRTANATKESLHAAIIPNVNVLSDGKSLHTQCCCSVAHVVWRETYTGPLITCHPHSLFTFALRTSGIFFSGTIY